MEGRRTFLLGALPRLIGLTLLLSLTLSPTQAHQKASSLIPHLKKPKYISLLKELRNRHGFQGPDLQKLFSQAKLEPDILKLYEKPKENLPYPRYKSLLLSPKVTSQGKRYLQRNREIFHSVEQAYNVDSSVLAAILGV